MRMTRDVLAGGLFSAIGAAALFGSMNYSLGTPASMGPGFFPVLVSGSIALLGLALLATALTKQSEGERPDRIHWRPLVLITAAVALFAVLQDWFGLIPALVGMIVLSAFAAGARKPLEIVAITLLLVAIAYGVFVLGLNIPFRLWVL